MTPEEMPYASVSLIAPLDDCDGGLGGGGDIGGVGIGGGGGGIGEPTYPSADFVREGCCYVARFNLACQEWSSETCMLYAKQPMSLNFKTDNYRIKVAYPNVSIFEPDPSQYDCPCIHATTTAYDEDRITRTYAVERSKLKAIEIRVGKVLVQCESGSPICRFFIAANYVYDTETAFLPVATGSYYRLQKTCTGVYRVNNCTFNDVETETYGDVSDGCPAGPYFPAAFAVASVFTLSRLKLYATLPPLPAADITITATDKPPFSCCGDSVGCQLMQQPCGLNPVDCLQVIGPWDGSPLVPTPGELPFCFDLDEFEPFCPIIVDKTEFVGTSPAFLKDGPCSSTCEGSSDFYCTETYPGFDDLVCTTELDPLGNYVYPVLVGSPVDDCPPPITPPGEGCTVDGCGDFGGNCGYLDSTQNCDAYIFDGGNILTAPCPDLWGYCRRDIYDLTCEYGTVTSYGAFNLCPSIPSVTLRLA